MSAVENTDKILITCNPSTHRKLAFEHVPNVERCSTLKRSYPNKATSVKFWLFLKGTHSSPRQLSEFSKQRFSFFPLAIFSGPFTLGSDAPAPLIAVRGCCGSADKHLGLPGWGAGSTSLRTVFRTEDKMIDCEHYLRAISITFLCNLIPHCGD